jgi:transcriptional regulator with XRE-family HTH domain
MRDPGPAIRTRVGTAIRRLRLQRRLSQEGLAERAGTSGKYVGEIERGQGNVTVDILAHIARALSVDAGDLFTPPRGRQRSETARLIPLADLDHIGAIVARAKGPGTLRSKRPSR